MRSPSSIEPVNHAGFGSVMGLPPQIHSAMSANMKRKPNEPPSSVGRSHTVMRANLLHSPFLLRRRLAMQLRHFFALALLAAAPALAQQEPIKVGALLELTGVFAPNGQDALDGLQLYL